MLTNSKIKLIQSLDKKKFRQKYNLFVIEGNKIIKELKNSKFKLEELFILEHDDELITEFPNTTKITEQELRKISFLKNPSKSLALIKLPKNIEIKTSKLQIVLDEIQDPGNLGTIIRLCDWFGIEQIICSNTTVDVFNPKCIQASMGSIFRVQVFYTDLIQHFNNNNLAIISTTLEGENLYETNLPKSGFLILGNEGNGISKEIIKISDRKITIPQFNLHQKTESLNVAMATSIILSRWISNQNNHK